jgi:hypothetical protein
MRAIQAFFIIFVFVHLACGWKLTGIKRDLVWKGADCVSEEAENLVQDSNVLLRRGEFVSALNLPSYRIDEIEAVSNDAGVTLDQALSMRKQSLVTKITMTSGRLRRELDNVKKDWQSGTDILKVSKTYDLPPVSIIRAILLEQVRLSHPTWYESDIKKLTKRLIQSGERHNYLANDSTGEQLILAKLKDQSSYTDPASMERDAASSWEQSLYSFLDLNSINYVKEEVLFGQAATPDVLLLDDVRVNGSLIRWIDSKNYFGSGSAASYHFIKKLKKQITKYDMEFEGNGAIVYRLNYSKSLETNINQKCLLLDKGPLTDIAVEEV